MQVGLLPKPTPISTFKLIPPLDKRTGAPCTEDTLAQCFSLLCPVFGRAGRAPNVTKEPREEAVVFLDLSKLRDSTSGA